jgi:hypothetical protein
MSSIQQWVMDWLWARGVRPSAMRRNAEHLGVTIGGRPLADFMSGHLPQGYDTVMGYLARTNPESVALLPDFVDDTQRDGWWLVHRSRRRGVRVIKVQAPLVLRERGIEVVNAYSVDLLRERFDD